MFSICGSDFCSFGRELAGLLTTWAGRLFNVLTGTGSDCCDWASVGFGPGRGLLSPIGALVAKTIGRFPV